MFTYGLGHPMKPHRIRMAHDLISAYGMLDKMHVLVIALLLNLPGPKLSFLTETKTCFTPEHDTISHRRVYTFLAKGVSRNGGFNESEGDRV